MKKPFIQATFFRTSYTQYFFTCGKNLHLSSFLHIYNGISSFKIHLFKAVNALTLILLIWP